MRYLDPVSLAKLKNLTLELRGFAVEGMVSGRHQSLWKGFSHDFAEHRPYVPGDELKALDWKIYARQDRFYIREYKAENVLTTHVLVDASGSMNFCAGGRQSKWEHACRLAMAMAYLTLAKGDAAGMMTFDVEPRQSIPPRASFRHLELMDSALAGGGPKGETNLSYVLEQAAARVRRRSLVILISDLLGDAEAIIKVIKAFKARRHELLILQILDPQERDFEYQGSAMFESLEGGPPLFCDADALRASYRREFERFLKGYEVSFHRCGAAYSTFFTDRPWEHALGQLLNRWR